MKRSLSPQLPPPTRPLPNSSTSKVLDQSFHSILEFTREKNDNDEDRQHHTNQQQPICRQSRTLSNRHQKQYHSLNSCESFENRCHLLNQSQTRQLRQLEFEQNQHRNERFISKRTQSSSRFETKQKQNDEIMLLLSSKEICSVLKQEHQSLSSSSNSWSCLDDDLQKKTKPYQCFHHQHRQSFGQDRCDFYQARAIEQLRLDDRLRLKEGFVSDEIQNFDCQKHRLRSSTSSVLVSAAKPSPTSSSSSQYAKPIETNGKRSRTSFTENQLDLLQKIFKKIHRPDRKLLQRLSYQTNLSCRVIEIWFQNQRSKWSRSILYRQPKRGPIKAQPSGQLESIVGLCKESC
ncbi:DNA replication complex GINS protein PSF1-like [Sarcoptes scabiei]|nr:DNA replication complex GINS protein PSF1-like [Sarcoptes scabiei]